MTSSGNHVTTDEEKEAAIKHARTRSALERDIRLMEKGKLTSGDLRRLWQPHFSSPQHMSVCSCYGICPFRG